MAKRIWIIDRVIRGSDLDSLVAEGSFPKVW